MKKRKKVLVFASTFPRWKNDTNPPFVYELSKRLTKWFDIVVLAPHYPGAKTFEVMDGMKVYRFRYFFERYEKLAGSGGILPMLKKNKMYYFQVPCFILAEFFALRRIVKKERPDVIHAHWIIPQGLMAALAGRGIPYVVTTHGGDIFGLRNTLLATLKRFTLRKAHKISVVSTAIKEEIRRNIDSTLTIEVIPMGIDTQLFSPKQFNPELKKKHGIEGLFLLFAGRLAEKKGVQHLIDAMPDILNAHPRAKLLIVGSGPLENRLKKMVEDQNLSQAVIFVGPVTHAELSKYFATADFFVGPSVIAKNGDTEGFGLVFAEAAASGCIVIASDLPAIRDIINNGITGYLVPPSDSKAIGIMVSQLGKNMTFKKKLGFAARSYIVHNFDWEIISKKYSLVLS